MIPPPSESQTNPTHVPMQTQPAGGGPCRGGGGGEDPHRGKAARGTQDRCRRMETTGTRWCGHACDAIHPRFTQLTGRQCALFVPVDAVVRVARQRVPIQRRLLAGQSRQGVPARRPLLKRCPKKKLVNRLYVCARPRFYSRSVCLRKASRAASAAGRPSRPKPMRKWRSSSGS